MTALMPLIIFRDFISPFHFGKVVVFRSVVDILGVFYILLILQNKSYLPRINRIFLAFLFFTLAFSITTLTSTTKYLSFWGSLERMGGLWTFWHYFLYFIILTSVIRTRAQWKTLFQVMITVGILSAFYGFGQKTTIQFFLGSGGRDRIFGTIGNAALFAGYQIVVAFISLILLLQNNISASKRTFYALGFLIMITAALMAAVRGSTLGIIGGLIVFAYLMTIRLQSKSAKKAFILLLTILILSITVGASLNRSSFVQNSSYLRRVTDISFSAGTVKKRIWLWQAGLNGWIESPKTIILGWGPENFSIPFSKYFNPLFDEGPGSETRFDRAHNVFIEVLVTMGLIGLIAYMNLFVSLFHALRRKLKEDYEDALYGAGFTALIVAYLIHDSFTFDTSANFLVFFTVVGFISFMASEKDIPSVPSPQETALSNTLAGSLTALLLVAASFAIYRTAILTSRANYAATRAIVAGSHNDSDRAIAKFKESLSYDVPGKYEYRHKFAQYVMNNTGASHNILTLQFAIGEIQKNVDENPLDYLPLLYLANLNSILGREYKDSPYNDIALDASLRALKLSPKFIITYLEIAQVYVNKKDYKTAEAYFQKAVNLNPGLPLNIWYLGITQIQAGDTIAGFKTIKQAINKGYTLKKSDYPRLINAYISSYKCKY